MDDETTAVVRDLLRVRTLVVYLAARDPLPDDLVAIEGLGGRFALVPREAPIPASVRPVDASTYVRVR